MSSHQPFNTPGIGVLGLGGALGGQGGQQQHLQQGEQQEQQREKEKEKDKEGNGGEVAHIEHLSDHIGALYLNDEYSDVTLVVDGNDFNAHRVILAARSEYFRAMLFGGMKESKQDRIELKDTKLEAFKHLLKYIYTGHMSLGNLSEELILDVLGLAHQYGFDNLQTAISGYLRAVLSISNVCLIYDTAALYNLSDLIVSCALFMDRNATEIISHDSFHNLSASAIYEIISRDSFCAPEVEIFRAVHAWVTSNPQEESEPILSAVRLSLMSTPDLLKVVRPTGLVPPDVILDAIQSREESRDMELKYRGYLIPEENMAQPKHNATVLYGEVKQALLDGDSKNYDMERGFSRHPIDETHQDKGIIVRLGMQCIINHIRMLLWDRDPRAYSYYIDVSMDQKDWVRVVDHSKYNCRSWQELYFHPRVVRFIRIVGTHNTVNKVFHLVSLEAYYTKKPFKLAPNGIIIPQTNVATISMSASVIEGVCRSRNALLNGDTKHYDWDSGYTCHQLGSGAIMVQLAQPYALSSMKLLLWDCDERSYSYYIEVSVNKTEWDVVCDRSRETCRSWQVIRFPRRPVVYIKIVGTHNTANEVFHCVHFECPVEDDDDDDDIPPVPEEFPSGASALFPPARPAGPLRGLPDNDVESTASSARCRFGSGSSAGSIVLGAVGGVHNNFPMGASANSMARHQHQHQQQHHHHHHHHQHQWPTGAAAMSVPTYDHAMSSKNVPSPSKAGCVTTTPAAAAAASPPHYIEEEEEVPDDHFVLPAAAPPQARNLPPSGIQSASSPSTREEEMRQQQRMGLRQFGGGAGEDSEEEESARKEEEEVGAMSGATPKRPQRSHPPYDEK